MKKHILIFLLSIITLSAYAQPGSLSQSLIRLRVNDSTTVNGAHTSGYTDIYYNRQRKALLFWEHRSATDSSYQEFASKSYVQDVVAALSGGGHTIEDEGTPLTQRTKLNFVGAGVTVTDDSGDDATVVTISGGGTIDGSGTTNELPYWVDSNTLGSLAVSTYPSLTELSYGKGVTSAIQTQLNTKNSIANTAISLTDGAAITITDTKHTLTTTQSAITFTDTFTGDFTNIDITFNQTSATWTFPTGTLCVIDGTVSGDNTAVISATSGDKIVVSIWFVSSGVYRVAIKNFGQ